MAPEVDVGPSTVARDEAAGRSLGPALDILISWTHGRKPDDDSARVLRRRVQDELEWECLGADVTLVVPSGLVAPLQKILAPIVRVGCAAVAILRARMLAAQAEPRDLLVCFTTALPNADVIGRLRETLSRDPMFGAAAPRIAVGKAGDLLPLEPGLPESVGPLLPRNRFHELDELYIFPDRLFPCILVRKELVANLDPPELDRQSLADALLDVLHRARRCGFRAAVDNLAVIPVEADAAALVRESPLGGQIQSGPESTSHASDLAVRQQLRGCSLEALLAAAGPRRKQAAPMPMLLDCTGMGTVHNGTSVSILGLLDGFHASETAGWRITVMAHRHVQRFFNLRKRYPRFLITTAEDESRYAVALRLSQVWDLATWLDLHRRALAVAVSILDTIGIDILYPITAETVAAFQFTGEHADGLMYISNFSRERFRRRFGVAPGVREIVHYLSFSANDHVAEIKATTSGSHILVIGNDYDHKDVVRTVKMLADAFPFQSIKALGLSSAQCANVEALPSGSLSDQVVEELYEGSYCIVYPSFYEGFGLPIVKGLSHGKTVIARRSSLLREIAARVPARGRLLDFSTGPELITALGSVLHSLPHAEVPLRDALGPGHSPITWVSIGNQLLGYARDLVDQWQPEKWHQRNAVLSYVRPR